MRFAQFLTVFIAYILSSGCLADTLHPQDGPHADLRVVIEDELVRFSVGVNLAFLDTAVDVPRETLGELSPDESDRLLAVFRQYLIENAPCVINGKQVQPTFEHLEIYTHPDPGMMAIFPKMGARALIRATVVMRFDAPSHIESVDLTWPAYPLDLLATEMEQASSARPRMYFEAVLIANGKSEPARFTHAEPTLSWTRSESAETDQLLDLPAPMIDEAPESKVFVRALLIALVLTSIGFLTVRRKKTILAHSLGIASVLIALAFTFQLTIAPRLGPPPPPVLAEEDAQRVFRALHESMYSAFDYTAESDIYDHLASALHGDLLSELYEQIRLSLLQAEEEMKIGVVTGLQPIKTTILAIDETADSAHELGFEAVHRWRVDGTVYHWGHSHTRAHIYEARYRVEYTIDGWRLTEHELRSQLRIDPTDGAPFVETEPIQERSEMLGYPDL